MSAWVPLGPHPTHAMFCIPAKLSTIVPEPANLAGWLSRDRANGPFLTQVPMTQMSSVAAQCSSKTPKEPEGQAVLCKASGHLCTQSSSSQYIQDGHSTDGFGTASRIHPEVWESLTAARGSQSNQQWAHLLPLLQRHQLCCLCSETIT